MTARHWLVPHLAVASVFITLSTPVAQSPQVFRATTEVVLVDVLVRQGSRAVRNLKAEDFIVYDSGAPQRVEQVSQEQLPIDLTILLDMSGSTRSVAEDFRRGADRVADLLGPEDRVRLMAFATDVVELSTIGPRLPPPGAHPQMLSDGTSFYDALILTMARRTDPGRRHLIVTFTDADDTTSVSQPEDVAAGAMTSESIVHLVVPAPFLGPKSASADADRDRTIKEAIETTGGATTPLDGDAVDALKRIFGEIRQGYVLRYTPTWKSLPGWHPLSVRVSKPGVTVRARRGYYR